MRELAISRLLRTGVTVSMAVVLVGLTLTFIHHPDYVRSRDALHVLTAASADYPHTIGEVVKQLSHGRGQGIVMLGLFLLIATPVARVAFSIVTFAMEHDILYVIITAVVFSLLLLSFAIGAAG